MADQPEQDTNEVMMEDVETPHHDKVTDEPVLPDSEADDDLVTEKETTKPLLPYACSTPTKCAVL